MDKINKMSLILCIILILLVGCGNDNNEIVSYSKEDIPVDSPHLSIVIDDPLLDLGPKEFEKAYEELPDNYIINIKHGGEFGGLIEELSYEELSDGKITKKDAEKVKAFAPFYSGYPPSAISLQGLRFFRNLENIGLEYASVTNIAELKYLNKLNHISFISCNLVMDNPDKDLIFISNLQDPNRFGKFMIELSDVDLDDIKFLEGMSNLSDYYIDLSNNKIKDISPLLNLEEIYELELDDNDINDVSPLVNLKTATRISLANNPITDISALRNIDILEEERVADDPLGINIDGINISYNEVKEMFGEKSKYIYRAQTSWR